MHATNEMRTDMPHDKEDNKATNNERKSEQKSANKKKTNERHGKIRSWRTQRCSQITRFKLAR